MESPQTIPEQVPGGEEALTPDPVAEHLANLTPEAFARFVDGLKEIADEEQATSDPDQEARRKERLTKIAALVSGIAIGTGTSMS